MTTFDTVTATIRTRVRADVKKKLDVAALKDSRTLSSLCASVLTSFVEKPREIELADRLAASIKRVSAAKRSPK